MTAVCALFYNNRSANLVLVSMLPTQCNRCDVCMCTYCDRCDADSGEHLFDQSVAIIERLHHQTLLSGHLRERQSLKRCYKTALKNKLLNYVQIWLHW